MNCWGRNSSSQIASAIETLICADECTIKQMYISYVRNIIMVNVTGTLHEAVIVIDPNSHQLIEKVVFDWKTEFANNSSYWASMSTSPVIRE